MKREVKFWGGFSKRGLGKSEPLVSYRLEANGPIKVKNVSNQISATLDVVLNGVLSVNSTLFSYLLELDVYGLLGYYIGDFLVLQYLKFSL